MSNKKMLSEQSIGDIILCDPITRRGKEALYNLGLSEDDISRSFFFNNIRVESIYDSCEANQYPTKKYMYEDNLLYYKYTASNVQIKDTKDRLTVFNERFVSDVISQYPLLILGVAGNGKSIEANRRILVYANEDIEYDVKDVYLDLESSFTKITYGIDFICPNKNALWLFCIKLLDCIMKYIIKCKRKDLCATIYDNFNNIICEKNIANNQKKIIFQNIKNYNDANSQEKLFCSILEILDDTCVEHNIQELLELLLIIIYCCEPNVKHYIIFDNIEQYIILNNSRVQIPNSDISKLYQIVNDVVCSITNAFDRIKSNLGWKAFKIVIVLRRTSLGQLDNQLLHSPVKGYLNATDFTGFFQVSSIWKNKKMFIWDKLLKDNYETTENDKIISLADFIMDDDIQTIGLDYQSIIAPLMSYGIRRNARAQAHAIFETYEMLTNYTDNTLIHYEEFQCLKNIMLDNEGSHGESKYMFRRALVEIQFKWAINNGNKQRWRELNIGHLDSPAKKIIDGEKFIIERVQYNSIGYVSLFRRILTYLSLFMESDIVYDKSKLVIDMFETVSIYNLLKFVLVNPSGDKHTTRNDFVQFAKVLIALSNMSFNETKSAPFVILGINDDKFHQNPCDTVLADILSEIWEAGEEKSSTKEKYNFMDYGVRITDAGYSFLLDWFGSYSFIAALHCFTIPPLFFLKNPIIIKYVIKTVYNASDDLCRRHEQEAASFFGPRTAIYLPKDGKFIPLRKRIKELHSGHLNLYKSYLINNQNILGLSENEVIELTDDSGYISQYIQKYESWNTEEGAQKCF